MIPTGATYPDVFNPCCPHCGRNCDCLQNYSFEPRIKIKYVEKVVFTRRKLDNIDCPANTRNIKRSLKPVKSYKSRVRKEQRRRRKIKVWISWAGNVRKSGVRRK